MNRLMMANLMRNGAALRPISIGLLLMLLSIISLSLAAAEESPRSSDAQQQVVILGVQGMTCAMCTITIRKALTNIDGVVTAKVDSEANTVTVTFDAAQTTITELTRATTDAGYPSFEQQP